MAKPSIGPPPDLEKIEEIVEWIRNLPTRDSLRARLRREAEEQIVSRQSRLSAILPADSECVPWVDEALTLALEIGRISGEAYWELGVYERLRMGAKRRSRQQQNSGKAAHARRRKTARSDAQIRALAVSYRSDHPLSREHSTRSLAAYMARRLKANESTIRGRLAKLGLK
jgi:hypothetical protein